MTRVRVALSLVLITIILMMSGCAQVMGVLRRDLDDDEFADGPIIGGRWSEHGFLSEDLPERGSSGDRHVGHAERGPASYGRSGGPRSWVTAENEASNRRDAMRGHDDEDDESVNSDNSPVLNPGVKRQYKNGSRATRADFVDESQNEGSLWASDGQTNYYFTKNKIRGVGDIVTINVEQDLIRDIGLEARRGLTPRERDYEMNLAQERHRAKALGLPSPDADPNAKDQVATTQAAPAKIPGPANTGQQAAPEPEIPVATPADIDVSKSMAIKVGDQMMGEIVERYPNGNYKVRATKRIPYKGGAPRFVTLIGVVKGSDIAEDDTVASGKLYEYRVEAAR